MYLLDTNICIFLLRGKYHINDKINAAGWDNCYISEITIAELKYGAECSDNPSKNMKLVNKLIDKLSIIPILKSLDTYAKEKARLKKKGILIDDFDLLIGCAAVAHNMVLITENEKHLKRLSSIRIENWVNRKEP